MTKKHLHTLADQEDRKKYRMVRVSPTLYRALSDLTADEEPLRLNFVSWGKGLNFVWHIFGE